MAGLLTVLLNWRSAEMTLRATEAALLALQGIEGALVIVDNDSGDGSFEVMQAEAQKRGWDKGAQSVRVLQSGRNGGFGAGNNYGIRAGMPDGSAPEFVYILNSDAFPERSAIHALLDHLKTNTATGFAGSFIYGADGEAHRTAFRFPSILSEFEAQVRFGPISRLLNRWVVAQPIPEKTRRVDWLAGASLMMRMNALDGIGVFDERFFLYFEETDLCRRAALSGWPTDYVLESRVMHIGSASTGMREWQRIPRFWLDSRLHYFVKNHGVFYTMAATFALLAGGFLWRARLLVQRKDVGDPPLYLMDITLHALGALVKALFGGRVSSHKSHPAAEG
ncbi:MAG: glycosyltransferase family 2 protein [Cypionkella sp.]|uniref:glycosyltransferase family 2 protein n=1 Tax=Cypionkella sp. TaxID=2811411 RepID=UPI002635C1CF|nr:glycosyltransferase family 2 protein [Cypionkella sp.]MDB5658715.1 glycosyltransferase family 2 protein [Cypionkella sp.]